VVTQADEANGALGQITAHITQISDMNIQVATATEEQSSVVGESTATWRTSTSSPWRPPISPIT
jgi:methyl-accepting chemotaxis protein